ncbi:hypothetical protein OQX61_18425 [Pedobacter sp. PLR]|uniref:hypothetical protein n=1 Tax=Pedobacter sp. PLR TaxID=2994465 RepID=UPI00224683F0|nr:hypothetical protein [Pedobacter sp. PLR]MCX2453259.1 hypothetical protein [Pedobacter sp. PLR]
MKKSILYLACMAVPLVYSCTQGNNSEKTAAAMVDTTVSSACYLAIDSLDTADLHLNTSAKGKITGDLVINFKDKGDNVGKVAGEFRGDTLFVDYTFKIGKENPVVYKNPLAFLKKDGKLILGVGQIETSVGRSYFVKGKPISFDKGRFTFAPVDCK